jgi:succinate dehydrogenase / fumarate reductase cytochrome b subunit
MLPTGLVLLFFVLYHLGHFTIGVIHPEYFRMVDSLGRHDVYSMTILGFQEPLIALFYLAAMGLLGMHLGHGVASTLQSMGWRRPRLAHLTEVSGRLIALIVVIGNMAIPLAALTGVIEPMQRAL